MKVIINIDKTIIWEDEFGWLLNDHKNATYDGTSKMLFTLYIYITLILNTLIKAIFYLALIYNKMKLE